MTTLERLCELWCSRPSL